MSKSGQSSSKAETGGQRVPRSETQTPDDAKKTPKPPVPGKKDADKKKA